MKYKGAAVAAVLACGLVCSAQDSTVEKEKFVSKEGGFTVRFPPGAVVSASTADIPNGLKAYITAAFDKAERRTYTVTYTPHQRGVLRVQAKETLDFGEKVTLAQPMVTRLAVKNLTYGKEKLPARDILYDRDGNQTRTRFIVAEPTLYTLVVGGPKEFASSKEALDFLDTFEITPPGKAKTKK